MHSCCAPCSSACIEALKEYFRLTVFYYNPNIDEDKEYEKRKAEQIRFLQTTGWADFLDCEYDKNAFEAIAAGMESEPERGKRCYLCYGLRLDRTARAAAENGFEWFCTTLSLSPYKNADWLNGGKIRGAIFGFRFQKEGGILSLVGAFRRIRALSTEFLRLPVFQGRSGKKKKRENFRRRIKNRVGNGGPKKTAFFICPAVHLTKYDSRKRSV